MKEAAPGSGERPSEGLSRKHFLRLLGVALVAGGTGGAWRLLKAERPVGLVRPERTGTPSPEVREALLRTARSLAEHLRFGESFQEEVVAEAIQLKCSEQPSYLGLYERYAEEVRLPAEMSARWVEELEESYRVLVVGELAVLLLVNGGFRAFGFQNFNGYLAGSWHQSATSGAFRVSKD
ncbi:hypothetical protein [Archangium lipolyticum]|uniref:hypothetical protein n=1 Tax=Archangium lipolyticum TaxID=2970465 RepID=UPI002149E1AA|nr:hypothetical protein [Archangium lipolyticum]